MNKILAAIAIVLMPLVTGFVIGQHFPVQTRFVFDTVAGKLFSCEECSADSANRKALASAKSENPFDQFQHGNHIARE